MADRSVALVVTLERDTEELYARGYRSLQQFCLEKRNSSVTQLADRHPREFNSAFSEWVQECYAQELPRYLAEAGLLAVGKQCWWVRGQLKPCWDLMEE